MPERTDTSTSLLACGDATPRDRRNLRRYQTAMVLFAVTYVASAFLVSAGAVSRGGPGWVVAWLPSVVALLPVVAFVRFLAEADELQRLIQLQALAMGLTAWFVLWPALRLLGRLGVPISDWSDA
jgi:hypothetical protein